MVTRASGSAAGRETHIYNGQYVRRLHLIISMSPSLWSVAQTSLCMARGGEAMCIIQDCTGCKWLTKYVSPGRSAAWVSSFPEFRPPR